MPKLFAGFHCTSNSRNACEVFNNLYLAPVLKAVSNELFLIMAEFKTKPTTRKQSGFRAADKLLNELRSTFRKEREMRFPIAHC